MIPLRFAISCFCLGIGASLAAGSAHGGIRALDYATPAYIDFELGQVLVTEDQETVLVHVIRTGDFRRPTTLSYATEAITADEGTDYKGTGGTLIFQPGEGYKEITVALLGNRQVEGEETFRIVLTGESPQTVLMRDSTLIRLQGSKPLPIPALAIAPAGDGKISLSWHASEPYSLEKSSDANAWAKVEAAPEVRGDRHEVIEPAGGPLFFYRLRAD